MFDVVTSASAEGASIPGVDQLGPFPLIQAFVIAVVALAGVIMWLRGERAGQKQSETPRPHDADVHMHFDGPLVEFTKQVTRLADAAEQIPEAARMLIAVREDLIRKIDESRHALRTEVQGQVIARFERDLAEIEGRIQRIGDSLDERVRKVGESVAMLEGRMHSIAKPGR